MPDVSFPDLGVTVPRTTDGLNNANFTKLMPINFETTVTLKGQLTSTQCEGTGCRVEFGFAPDQLNKVAQWNEFEKAYVPNVVDVASNNFECDKYKTLFVKAIKQGGPDSGLEGTAQKDFFINCDTKLTVVPLEKRVVLGAQPGKSFNVTAWNPGNTDKTFEVAATTTESNGFPLPWTLFQCESAGCEAGPVAGDPWLTNDDKARLTAPSLTSRSVTVFVATAAKSGAFPITFVATANGNSYSAVGTLLIFAEGLDEFAAWQLAGLMMIVIAVLYYSDFSMAKTANRRKKK